MEKTITMRARKNPDPKEQRSLLKLKGSLIFKGYTRIIHMQERSEGFHSGTFEIPDAKPDKVRQYVAAFITA